MAFCSVGDAGFSVSIVQFTQTDLDVLADGNRTIFRVHPDQVPNQEVASPSLRVVFIHGNTREDRRSDVFLLRRRQLVQRFLQGINRRDEREFVDHIVVSLRDRIGLTERLASLRHSRQDLEVTLQEGACDSI